MKFIFKGNGCKQFFEFGRMKKVDTIKIKINDVVYEPNVDIDLKQGEYQGDVIVIYNEGDAETIKNQNIKIGNKDLKVTLDMMSVWKRLINLFVNIRWIYIILAIVILSSVFGEIGMIIATAIALGLFYAGNDFVLKQDGFDKTFRAKFRKKIL